MKPIGIVILGLFLMLPSAALSDDREAAVRTAIQSFYKAFDDGFVGPADYATEDWNHINPLERLTKPSDWAAGSLLHSVGAVENSETHARWTKTG